MQKKSRCPTTADKAIGSNTAVQQYLHTFPASCQPSDLPDDGIQPDLPDLLKKNVSRQP